MKGLRFGGGVRYNGASVGGTDPFYNVQVRAPQFTLFDATLAYAYENWRFSANVFNIADKKYVAACGDPTACFYGAPRRFVIGARYT